MKTKHTPGPWRIGDGYSAHKTTVFGGPKGHIVAKAESEDDARLIAAAPDLLAALSDLLAIEGIDGDRGIVIAKCFSAIAKAKGE